MTNTNTVAGAHLHVEGFRVNQNFTFRLISSDLFLS